MFFTFFLPYLKTIYCTFEIVNWPSFWEHQVSVFAFKTTLCQTLFEQGKYLYKPLLSLVPTSL